jgi:hypothetical protein
VALRGPGPAGFAWSILAAQHVLGNAAVLRLLAPPGNAPPGQGVIQRSLSAAFGNFEGDGSCSCGESLPNNCAHFLSDALIRAGYSELDGGKGGLYRRKNGRAVCKHGRPVRAREMKTWFESKATDSMEGEPREDSRHWAVWQGGGGYWGGHVVLHKHTGEDEKYEKRGTGDYPAWPTQDHYTW